MRRGGWAVAAATGGIIAATLLPADAATARHGWRLCTLCGEYGSVDFALNVLLYAPLGLALGLRRRSGVSRSLVAALILSVTIEWVQLMIPGRDSTLGDILANVSGAALGLVLLRQSSVWLRPNVRLSSRLCMGAGLSIVAIQWFTWFSLAPDYPSSTYFGQWTPELGHLEHYTGRVLTASVGRIPLPGRRLARSDEVRTLLERGRTLSVRFIAGPAVASLAPIFSIFDDRRREIQLLGADRQDVVLRYRTRAAAMKLHQPDIRLSGVLRTTAAGDTLGLRVRRDHGTDCMSLGPTRNCRKMFAPGRGWSLLWFPDSGVPRILELALDFLWIACLSVPAGVWWRRDLGATLGLMIPILAPLVLSRFIPANGVWLAAIPPTVVGFAAGAAFRRRLIRAFPGR